MTSAPIQATLFDAAEAARLALAGMERATRAERVQAWKQAANEWLDALAAGTIVTSDDLVAALGLPDPSAAPASNNVLGGWFGSHSKAARIVWTGKFRKSERAIGHGNLLRVWRVS